MAQRFRELIGRAMIDPDFVAELQRSPDVVLSQFELTPDEERLVRSALIRLAKGPATLQADELKSALLRRVAT